MLAWVGRPLEQDEDAGVVGRNGGGVARTYTKSSAPPERRHADAALDAWHCAHHARAIGGRATDERVSLGPRAGRATAEQPRRLGRELVQS